MDDNDRTEDNTGILNENNELIELDGENVKNDLQNFERTAHAMFPDPSVYAAFAASQEGKVMKGPGGGDGPEENIPERIPAYSAANMQEVDDDFFKEISVAEAERAEREAVERAYKPCGICGCAMCEGKENKTRSCEKCDNDGCNP
jgi:hypothetical protein